MPEEVTEELKEKVKERGMLMSTSRGDMTITFILIRNNCKQVIHK